MTIAKALSIKQPWANMLINGEKSIEIRNWRTPYRGTLLIHTGKTYDPVGKAMFNTSVTPLGCILGRVNLINIKSYGLDYIGFCADHNEHKNLSHWYTANLFGWIFINPIRFANPPKVNGRTGIFPVKIDEALLHEN